MSAQKRTQESKEQKNSKLSDQVKKSIESYFKDLNGEIPCDVYQLVLSEMEKPLLEVVMSYVDNNQSQASKILGINRNTLRKKLDCYDLS